MFTFFTSKTVHFQLYQLLFMNRYKRKVAGSSKSRDLFLCNTTPKFFLHLVMRLYVTAFVWSGRVGTSCSVFIFEVSKKMLLF